MIAPEEDNPKALRHSPGPDLPSTAGDAPTADSHSDLPVTVVGIGASAGGLTALSDFFRGIPSKTGLAYVIVQHLSPTHESILAELLGRHAAIPVHQASNGMRVDVNGAYVIAPDTKMTLTDGHLKLVPRDPDARPPLPVDAFFRSLADVQAGRTMGVILSGTGSDGALGVRAIKGAGGMTFVQDPTSASSNGMPLSAIATGCVDVIALPAEIAVQLVQLGRHPYLRLEGDGAEAADDTNAGPASAEHAAPQAAKSGGRTATRNAGEKIDVPAAQSSGQPGGESGHDDAVMAIIGLLRRRFGVDFSLYKTGTVERRIRRRMALRKIDAFKGYADVLRRDAGELGLLYSDLLIGVTRFFRDSVVFDELSQTVLPRLLKQRAEREADGHSDDQAARSSVRIWVPGCSTGEEAYSIAICVLEFLDDHAPGTPVQIFATDLSESAITFARAAAYPQGIEADVTPERLRRFFTQEESGYRVTKAIRDCCIFARQNITADPPFSQMDMVSCRNLLIYLQPSVHTRILAIFHYALKPGGVLLLGTSESNGTAPSLFTPIDKKHRVYVRAPGPSRPLYLDSVPAHPVVPAAAASTGVNESHDHGPPPPHGGVRTGVATDSTVTAGHRSPTVPDVQRMADQVVLGNYAPAAVVVDDRLMVIQFRGQTGSYIEPAAGTASLHLLRLVKSELAAALRAAVNTARAEARPVRSERVSFHDGSRPGYVTLDVTPFRVTDSDEQFFIVSFEKTVDATTGSQDADRVALDEARDRAGHPRARGRKSGTNTGSRKPGDAIVTPELANDLRTAQKLVGELRQELEAKQRHLQALTEEHASAIEEFQAANEEIQSSNEELQSTNEEVETSKEELQSLNEELTTLNDELRIRNTDATRTNDDLTNLLTAMHVPVIMVDTQLRLRRFTVGSERIANLIPTDIGRPVGDIKSNIDVANLDELITRVIATMEVTEREVRDLDGCWYLMTIRPYRTSDHKIDGAVITYQDIDERKRAGEELVARAGELEITTVDLREKTAEAQASNRAKSDFLATMSHELRTPLNAIGGYTQLLDMGIRGPVTEAQRADLAHITRSQQHLMGLINEILNFAKLEAGGVVITPADVNVAELLASVDAMVAVQMTRKGLRYEVRASNEHSELGFVVRGDEDKARQILLNLLTNALKFTERGGSVDVTCDASDGYVSISVRDSGVGISADHQTVIFDPFIQVNPSLTRANDGVGLGLAISRELARAMGGDITVESAVGAGATFRLTLPRVEAAVDNAPDSTSGMAT